jgi:hypothetical protein
LIDPDPPRYVVSTPIFVSYSSKDQKIAETFCRALEARGCDCRFMAQVRRRIHPAGERA